MTTRTLFVAALLVTLVVGAQARLLPYLPGDQAVLGAVQSLIPGRAWVAPAISTAQSPLKYGLMAIAVLGAWRLAGARAALVVIAAIALEQTFAESTKALFGRPRPSRDLVVVMGTPSGLSFPSTFMTLYGVTVGALVALAWLQRPGPRRTGVIVAGMVVLVFAACTRIVPAAHWPSDTVGTLAICMSWLAVAFSAAGVGSHRR